MKITFTTMAYLPHIGGIEIYIHEIAQYLIKKGHDVSIIVADKNCVFPTEEMIEKEKIIRIPTYEICNFPVLKKRAYLKIIENEIKFADVVHVNVSKFLFGYFAKKKNKYNYKLLATSHGWLYHTNKYRIIKNIYFKKVIAKYSAYYDTIINVSPQDQEITNRFGISNACVILNGVNLKKFSDIPEKERFSGVFIYFGRISENKGIYECLKKLAKYNRSFLFYIIGNCEDAEYMDKLKNFICTEKMEEKIVFCGSLTDYEIRNKIIESDIVLMPSLHEGFGMTLVECLVSNRPIIANKNESYEYILKSTDAEVFLFDFCDEESLISEKIEFLKKHRVYPKNIEQYSIETMAKKTMDVYGI